MRYTCEIDINLPIEKVMALFDNPHHLKAWQPSLQLFEPLSGMAGQAGAKSRLVYQMGSRQIEMIETIIVRKWPDEFSATYEAKGVFNRQFNYFRRIGDRKTRWVSDCEFKFSGFMKLVAFFMPGAFRKQSMLYLEQFKAFAEKEAQRQVVI